MATKFKIGARVKFKGVEKPGDTIPQDYKSDYDKVPAHLIRHGSTVPGADYFKSFARIEAKYAGLYIVSYTSNDGKKVQLGFEPSELEYVGNGERKAPELAPKFILQYERDTDPFELFVTEKELRARIAELAADTTVKRDSIKVYDIKRIRTVELGVKITIK